MWCAEEKGLAHQVALRSLHNSLCIIRSVGKGGHFQKVLHMQSVKEELRTIRTFFLV